MTLHTEKGQESDAVALAGLEHGMMPHRRATQSEAELEEERRLCFVGITRARRHLMISRAVVRTHRGMRERTIASQFLGELPADKVATIDLAGYDDFESVDRPHGFHEGRGSEFGDDRASDTGSWRPRGRGSGAGAVVEFPVGCTVRHPKFGIGRVEAITRRPAGSSARVTFRSVGTKTLILEYAKLVRVD